MTKTEQIATFFLTSSTASSSWASIREVFEDFGFVVSEHPVGKGFTLPTALALKNKLDNPALCRLSPERLNDLTSLFKDFDDSHVLLFYTRPELHIHQALTQNKSVAVAITEWKQEASKLLEVFRSNRRRVTLLMDEYTLGNLEQTASLLAERLSCSIRVNGSKNKSFTYPKDQYFLIASHAVVQDKELMDLLLELEASTLQPVILTEPIQVDCDYYVKEMDKAKLEQNSTKLNDLTQENELLIQQLHIVQEELERVILSGTGAKELKIEIEKQKQQIESLKKSKAELLKKYKAIFESTSWKVTKPLRAIGRLLKGKPMRAKSIKNKG